MAQASKRYDLLVVREEGEGDNKKNWWTKIGVGWENRTGDGYQLVFEALPVPGKDGVVKVIMKQPSEREDRR